jgi:methionyl-tRNA formyltransferase
VRVAFFGLPLAALLLLADGHEIPLACVSRPGSVGMRRLVRKLGRAAVLSKPDVETDALLRRVREARPDLVVSWFWTTRIPPRVLASAPHGGIGVHPSLLPRHRGPDPYYWAIATGDVESGVTAHALDDAYDTGPILAQRRMALDPAWDAWTLARRLDRPSLALLREVVASYARGEPPSARVQDERLASSAPSPSDGDLTVRWAEPTDTVVRRIRAASPWPGAVTQIGELPVTLTRVGPAADYPAALAPGEAVVRGNGIAVVRTLDGAVELLEGRAPGDDDGDDEPLDARGLAALLAERAGARGA